MSLSGSSRISRWEALGPVIQMAGYDQGTDLGHCLRLVCDFIMGGLGAEGSLVSRLPFAATTDMHIAKGMSLVSQPLPSNLLKYGQHICIHACCLKTIPVFTFPDRTFQIWLWIACSLERLMGFFSPPISFFRNINHIVQEKKNSWHTTKVNKIYLLKHLPLPFRIPLLSESQFLLRKQKWGQLRS